MKYYVKFDDGETFAVCNSLEEAKAVRRENNFRFLSRSLIIKERK